VADGKAIAPNNKSATCLQSGRPSRNDRVGPSGSPLPDPRNRSRSDRRDRLWNRDCRGCVRAHLAAARVDFGLVSATQKRPARDSAQGQFRSSRINLKERTNECERDLCSPRCCVFGIMYYILATSSGHPVSALIGRAKRVIATHLWYPAPLIPIVEVCPGPMRDPAAVAKTIEVLQSVGNEPVN
jgi:hypothetical protein